MEIARIAMKHSTNTTMWSRVKRFQIGDISKIKMVDRISKSLKMTQEPIVL